MWKFDTSRAGDACPSRVASAGVGPLTQSVDTSVGAEGSIASAARVAGVARALVGGGTASLHAAGVANSCKETVGAKL